jgi:hypothetical protein
MPSFTQIKHKLNYQSIRFSVFAFALLESSCASSIDIDTTEISSWAKGTFFQAFNEFRVQINNMLFALTYVIGIGIIISSLMQLKKFGQRTAMMQSNASLLGPVMRLFVGVLIMYLQEFMNIIYKSTFGSSMESILNDKAGDSSSGIDSIVKPMAGFIQFIGLIAIIRGFLVLQRAASESGNQPGQLSKGFTHIIGGILAFNIIGVIDLIQKSSGST